MADSTNLSEPCNWSGNLVPCDLPVPKRKITTYNIGRVLDAGHYGVVYTSFDDVTKKNIIVKIFKGSKEEIKHEICYQHLAADRGVAPPILDYWFCGKSEDRALIAMDYAGNYNLEAYLKTISNIEIKDVDTLRLALQVYPTMLNLYRQILILNNVCKIFHLDLHLKNAMVNVNKDFLMTGLKLIDFGKADNWKAYEESINERICSKNAPDSFEGIAFMYKAINVDIMMPTEFYHDLFITDRSLNPAMNWLFQDFIGYLRSNRYILAHKNWTTIKDMNDLNEEVGYKKEDMRADAEYHIETEYPDLYEEIEDGEGIDNFLKKIIRVTK